MYKIIIWFALFGAMGLWGEETEGRLLPLYEAVTGLQERVHRLESDSTAAQTLSMQKEWQAKARQETPSPAIPLNHAWVILCGVLVMVMQLGFAFVEAGLTRAKNAVHTLTMNMMDYCIGMMAYWAVGFAFMFGGVGAIASLGLVVVNTALSSAAGAIGGSLWSRRIFGKPDPTFACNGLLAGLVAVTAGCAYVEPWAAVLIGFIAGWLVVRGALFVEEKLKIDDPVGAISVHGVNGLWGVLALGLFASPALTQRPGLVYGEWRLMAVQAIGALAALLTFFVLGTLLFYVIGKFTTSRADDAEQEEGMDLSSMGVSAYNEE